MVSHYARMMRCILHTDESRGPPTDDIEIYGHGSSTSATGLEFLERKEQAGDFWLVNIIEWKQIIMAEIWKSKEVGEKNFAEGEMSFARGMRDAGKRFFLKSVPHEPESKLHSSDRYGNPSGDSYGHYPGRMVGWSWLFSDGGSMSLAADGFLLNPGQGKILTKDELTIEHAAIEDRLNRQWVWSQKGYVDDEDEWLPSGEFSMPTDAPRLVRSPQLQLSLSSQSAPPVHTPSDHTTQVVQSPQKQLSTPSGSASHVPTPSDQAAGPSRSSDSVLDTSDAMTEHGEDASEEAHAMSFTTEGYHVQSEATSSSWQILSEGDAATS